MIVTFQAINLMSLKDNRYKAIKSLILSKGITTLSEAFTIIPLSTVKDDMQVNYSTLRRRVNDSNTLTVRDMTSLAKLFDVPAEEILKLIISDIETKTRTTKRR